MGNLYERSDCYLRKTRCRLASVCRESRIGERWNYSTQSFTRAYLRIKSAPCARCDTFEKLIRIHNWNARYEKERNISIGDSTRMNCYLRIYGGNKPTCTPWRSVNLLLSWYRAPEYRANNGADCRKRVSTPDTERARSRDACTHVYLPIKIDRNRRNASSWLFVFQRVFFTRTTLNTMQEWGNEIEDTTAIL